MKVISSSLMPSAVITGSVDESSQQDPPETPAPVFAARALKSAFFGTPAPSDDTIYEIDSDSEKIASKHMSRGSRSMSPTKPQGILLTPGTATSRRKTVSFGTEVVEKEVKIAENKMEVGDGDQDGGKKVESTPRRVRKTSLTKTLEKSREGKAEQGDPIQGHDHPESQPLLTMDSCDRDLGIGSSSRGAIGIRRSNQGLMAELDSGGDFNRDMTIDLNEPNSQSGKYWKSEYENYSEGVKLEMKRLFKYKLLAKSFARRKDAEAVELIEKLREEQRRVATMEDKISRLSGQITSKCIDGTDDTSPELIKELAQQTALAVQYRAQVEEFQAALEENDELASGKNEKRFASPRTEITILETHHELKKAREQLKEVKSLREELSTLREKVSNSEKANQKLQEENTRLTRDLLHAEYRLEKQVEKSEKRRTSSEDHLRRKDEAYQILQKDYNDLKEQSKSTRREAEHLLKKRHDQVASFKKKLALLTGAESNAKDLQKAMDKRSDEHNQVVAGYLKEIARLKEAPSREINVGNDRTDFESDLRERRQNVTQNRSLPRPTSSGDAYYQRDSLIPLPSPSISRPPKSVAPSRQQRSETPAASPALKLRSSHSALLEITNNATKERLAFQKSDLVQFTPLADRFSGRSLDEPVLELPSPEPSLVHIPSRAIHDRRCYASPRPSMFNIASSPPKPATVRSQDNELLRKNSQGDLTGQRHIHGPSSRPSSSENSRARVVLPPERAAAAKARLEKRNAEKKKAHAIGAEKENTRV